MKINFKIKRLLTNLPSSDIFAVEEEEIMKRITVLAFLIVLLTLVACAPEGGNTTKIYTGGDDDSSPSDDDASPTDDDASPVDDDASPTDDDDDSTANQVSGKVLLYYQSGDYVPSPLLPVEALDNATLASFSPSVTTETDNQGVFSLTLPTGVEKVALRLGVAGSGWEKSTLVFDVAVGSTDLALYVSIQSLDILPGIGAAEGRGVAIGIVSWEGPSGYEPVGCAVVTSEPGPSVDGGIFHLNSFHTSQHRGDTDPATGFFVASNYAPGSYLFQAAVDGHIWLSPYTRVIADESTFVRIVFPASDFPTNPTPAGCVIE